jgi:hypothetical protein
VERGAESGETLKNALRACLSAAGGQTGVGLAAQLFAVLWTYARVVFHRMTIRSFS